MQYNHKSDIIKQEHYPIICTALGEPVCLDATQFDSLAHRVRNYWTNLCSTQQLTAAVQQVERSPRGAFRLVVLLLKLLFHAARVSYKAPSLLNAVGWKLGLWQHVATMCLVVLVAQLKCCKHQCKEVVKEKGKVIFIPHTGKKRWGHKRRDPKWYYCHYTQPEYPLHPGTSAQLYQSLCYNLWNGYLWFAYVSPSAVWVQTMAFTQLFPGSGASSYTSIVRLLLACAILFACAWGTRHRFLAWQQSCRQDTRDRTSDAGHKHVCVLAGLGIPSSLQHGMVAIVRTLTASNGNSRHREPCGGAQQCIHQC